MKDYLFDWSELAFGSKKPLKSLDATFVAAPRTLSARRFKQLVKQLLPKGNILLGISKEPFVDGFDGQPQFQMLTLKEVQHIVETVNAQFPHKIYVLQYFQRETVPILEKIQPPRAVFVNGSWARSFHTLPTYYALINNHIPYELVSPFSDELEAQAYIDTLPEHRAQKLNTQATYSDQELMELTALVATQSFDHTFQTGTVIASGTPEKGYSLVSTGFNKVVPYQTYAMHHGASREKHFSPPNDLNHYDTIHAEMMAVIEAHKKGISLTGASLFVNLLPCPTCSRTLAETDIAEIVYNVDHSDGYAVDLLTKAGKTVRRIVY